MLFARSQAGAPSRRLRQLPAGGATGRPSALRGALCDAPHFCRCPSWLRRSGGPSMTPRAGQQMGFAPGGVSALSQGGSVGGARSAYEHATSRRGHGQHGQVRATPLCLRRRLRPRARLSERARERMCGVGGRGRTHAPRGGRVRPARHARATKNEAAVDQPVTWTLCFSPYSGR